MQSSSQNVTTNKPTPNFLHAACPSCRPVNSVTALKVKILVLHKYTVDSDSDIIQVFGVNFSYQRSMKYHVTEMSARFSSIT